VGSSAFTAGSTSAMRLADASMRSIGEISALLQKGDRFRRLSDATVSLAHAFTSCGCRGLVAKRSRSVAAQITLPPAQRPLRG